MFELCTGDSDEVNKGKPHYFIVDSPAGEPTVNGKCKYCRFEREHRITPVDGMESGRQAMKLKREKAKELKAKLSEHERSESIRRL